MKEGNEGRYKGRVTHGFPAEQLSYVFRFFAFGIQGFALVAWPGILLYSHLRALKWTQLPRSINPLR